MTKKKSSIKIKPSHKGKFTRWAKRKGFSGVTDEAIRTALGSKDPTIRREAVFARNARKWKH